MRLFEAVRNIVAGLLEPTRYHALYRYRVVEMQNDRVALQAVSSAALLPDMQAISMKPGVSGCHAKLALGSVVLVAFVEGDPGQPVITHFDGKDGSGWKPVELQLSADKITVDSNDITIKGDSQLLESITLGSVTGPAKRKVVCYGDNIVFPSPGPGLVVMGTDPVATLRKVDA
jgi:hypothetical protein